MAKNDHLSPIQKRLWYASKLDEGLPTYNQPMAFHLKGKLNMGALEKALKTMVDLHPELRMGFPEKEGQPTLVMKDNVKISFIKKELNESLAPRFVEEFIREPIDLESPPLMRVALITLGKDDHIVAFNWHHIIVDGHSISIFLRQFSRAYNESA